MGQDIKVPKSGREPFHPVFSDMKMQLRLVLDALDNIQDLLRTLVNNQGMQTHSPRRELEEKIMNSEGPQPHPHPDTNKNTNTNTNTNSNSKKKTDNGDEVQVIEGTIQRKTAKALLIKFLNGQDEWIPKSTIRNTYNEAMLDQKQVFEIDTWVLEKNGVL